MSDPLSIAASVTGLITISAQIVAIAKELFGKVKDAPETMMRVKEEVESMEPIFHQVQLLLNGSGSLNRGNLTMIPIQNFMATLTGCVIVYTRLEEKVNGVCGFSDHTSSWKRAGVVVDRVKWGLWRHEDVLVIIEELQRHKLSLNIMLTILSCTTTTEVAKNQAKLLQEQTTELLQSNHAQSVLLRELISRQEEQARALDDIRSTLTGSETSGRSNMSTLGGTGSSTVSTRPPSASSRSDHRANSDNASTRSKRSTLSFRLGLPDYLEDLKESRAYKRLRHFGRGIDIDSSAESVFSSDSSGSTCNWSMLSDITLGGLSVSQIAVLNLPIELSDVINPEPFLEPSSTGTRRNSRPRPRRIWSSRGRIHNAIENGNEFAVRTVLAMGMDIEELDSNGRTPLIHAIMKHQEAICSLLLEKGASVGPLKAFTTGMDLKERSDLLDPLITGALDDGASSAYVAVLRLLVQMALGTNYGDDNRSSSQSMMNIAIDMTYELAVRALIKLDLQQPSIADGQIAFAASLAELFLKSKIDYYTQLDDSCRSILDGMNVKTNWENMTRARTAVSMHDVVNGGYKSILQLLSLIESRDAEGWTPLASAAFHNNEALCKFLVGKGCSLCLDTEQKNQLKPKLACRIHDTARAGHETALQLLLDMGADINERNSDGETALLEAVYYNHLSCVKILIGRGADATILANGGYSVLHRAAWRSTNSEMMKFVLHNVVETRKLVDMKGFYGNTALHDCSYSDSQSPTVRLDNAKMLLHAGASLAINDDDGQTPYQYARFQERMVLAKYLWSKL